MNNMILHAGAKLVDRAALDSIPLPPATDSWVPVAHVHYLETVHALIQSAGFRVQRERLALAPGRSKRRPGEDGAAAPVPGGRFFGVLDLDTSLSDGCALAVGVRNSLDQSFAMSFVAGSRVFVCDNLAFSGELMVSRKHTVNGLTRLREAVAGAIGRLEQFRAAESAAIERMKVTMLDDGSASALILDSYRKGVISARILPAVLANWDDPTFGTNKMDDGIIDSDHASRLLAEFGPRNAWSLYNAHTSALSAVAQTQPNKHAATTMRLRALFAEAIGAAPAVSVGPIVAYSDVD